MDFFGRIRENKRNGQLNLTIPKKELRKHSKLLKEIQDRKLIQVKIGGKKL